MKLGTFALERADLKICPAVGALTWIFHSAHETPTARSRRREEADSSTRCTHPPPHVGGYGAYEISGLTPHPSPLPLRRGEGVRWRRWFGDGKHLVVRRLAPPTARTDGWRFPLSPSDGERAGVRGGGSFWPDLRRSNEMLPVGG